MKNKSLHNMWMWVVLMLLLLTNDIQAKRCKGRYNVGRSCRASCNRASGRWVRKGGCLSRGGPQPEDCFTVSNKTCVLPLQIGGKNYKSCTVIGTVDPWCATEIDHVNYAENGDDLILAWDYCETENAKKICTETEGYCDYSCKSDRSCEYTYTGASTLGLDIPPVHGNCNDKSGLCEEPHYCIVGECSYSCGEDTNSTCTYTQSNRNYRDHPDSQLPDIHGDCADTSVTCYWPTYCTETYANCEWFCETPTDSGPPTCQYELTTGYVNRPEIQIPKQYGVCEESGPCPGIPCSEDTTEDDTEYYQEYQDDSVYPDPPPSHINFPAY